MRKHKFKVVDKNNGSCIIHPKSPFYRHYSKDTNVIAAIHSLGIMVFNTKDDAKDFISWHKYIGHDNFHHKAKSWKIKRVLPIGRGRTPAVITEMAYTKDIKKLIKLMMLDLNLSNIKLNMAGKLCSPVRGTMCYPGVYVID